jgi:hypothetical protein
MCLVRTPKAPPAPPPPRPDSRQEEDLRERRRLVRRQGQFLSPFAVTQSSYANPLAGRTLLGG